MNYIAKNIANHYAPEVIGYVCGKLDEVLDRFVFGHPIAEAIGAGSFAEQLLASYGRGVYT
jgi:hypothetical protein